MSEGSGQRYCGNCGAEIRSGTSFCVSCGASLTPNSQTPANSDDAVASVGASETEEGSSRNYSTSKDQDDGSAQDIYDEYALHRRFFQEARNGLIRFSERLKQGEGDRLNEHLTHKDLAGSLLYSQMGLDKTEEYKETLTAPLLRKDFSQGEVRSVLIELQKIKEEVLTSLEAFWDKLETEEGQAQFKDQFAKWYTGSLEPYMRQDVAQGGANSSPKQGKPQAERPMVFSADGQYGSEATMNELPNRIINWFRDLPIFPKLVLVGLLSMLLLTVLSPVALVVAIMVFVMSAVVLAIRAILREPLRVWIIAVVGSLVLIPIFGGISGAIYGGGSGSGEVGGSESVYDTSDNPNASNTGGSEANGGVAPGLEEATKEWASDIPKGRYILVPSYLTFNVEGHSNQLLSDPAYYMMYNSLITPENYLRHGLAIYLADPGDFYAYATDGTINIDGRSYYYSETMFLGCELALWETSGEPQAFRVIFVRNGTGACIPAEELIIMLESMVRVES